MYNLSTTIRTGFWKVSFISRNRFYSQRRSRGAHFLLRPDRRRHPSTYYDRERDRKMIVQKPCSIRRIAAAASVAVVLLLGGVSVSPRSGSVATTRIFADAAKDTAADAAAAAAASSAAPYTPGNPTQGQVVVLTRAGLDQALADHAANPLWLLKFYAPWYVRTQNEQTTHHHHLSNSYIVRLLSA
jgi:hypothetical protein